MAFRTNKTPVLQEKSASGSVATFNTALAMPLASCNIAVNAWQEGSGDPSPVNNRPIHGFSEVNATRAGKNLFDKNAVTYSKWIDNATGEIVDANARYCVSDYIPVHVGDVIHFPNKGNSRNGYFDRNKNALGYFSASNTTVTMAHSGFIVCTFDTNNVNLNEMQIEYGNVETAYEPYVTPTIYTIQLGQEVYGAEVDVVNGVAHVTHLDFTIDENTNIASVNWLPTSNGVGWFYNVNWDLPPIGVTEKFDGLCNILKPVYYNQIYAHTEQGAIIAITSNASVKRVYVWQNDTTLIDVASIKAWLEDNPIHLTYPLATPFDIQLTPTQIKTLIGNNTIFADTGDVDLTYKDLDLAKRGNFREVFKLPS